MAGEWPNGGDSNNNNDGDGKSNDKDEEEAKSGHPFLNDQQQPVKRSSKPKGHGRKMSLAQAARIAAAAHRSTYTSTVLPSLAELQDDDADNNNAGAQRLHSQHTTPKAQEPKGHRYSNSSFAMLRRMTTLQKQQQAVSGSRNVEIVLVLLFRPCVVGHANSALLCCALRTACHC